MHHPVVRHWAPAQSGSNCLRTAEVSEDNIYFGGILKLRSWQVRTK